MAQHEAPPVVQNAHVAVFCSRYPSKYRSSVLLSPKSMTPQVRLRLLHCSYMCTTSRRGPSAASIKRKATCTRGATGRLSAYGCYERGDLVDK